MKQLLLAALAAAPLLAAAAPALQPIPDPARLTADVKVLASDAFEGRGPATTGEDKTIAYLIQQMEAAGLEPGGEIKDGKRAWTQDVPLARFEIRGPLRLDLTAGGRADPLAQGQQIAIRAAQTNVDRVAIKDAPLVFVGYGVKAPERGWDDFKGVDLKGKIAVVLINDPDFETGQGDFGGKAMTYYGRWTYKFEEGARQGALGVLIVHETAPASYGWETVKNSNTNAQFDIVRPDPARTHPTLEGWVQRDVAVDLFKRSGLDFEALKKQAQTRGFKPVVLAGASLSADYAVDHKVIVSHNVLGRLTGAKRPDETVIYSAHWDHLGVGAPDARGDRIYNGAVDNATGVAALLELGRMFAAAPRTERTVVFMSVTAEEKYLLGSEYYAANPIYPLSKTVGDVNMDMLGVWGRTRDISTFGGAENDLLDRLIAVGVAHGLAYTPDPSPEAGHFYRSDHFSLSKRGVPALSFSMGDDLVVGGRAVGAAKRNAYNAQKYHQPGDEWSPDWDMGGQVQAVSVLYDLGRGLAQSRDWPEWKAGAEFKAARDATAGERR